MASEPGQPLHVIEQRFGHRPSHRRANEPGGGAPRKHCSFFILGGALSLPRDPRSFRNMATPLPPSVLLKCLLYIPLCFVLFLGQTALCRLQSEALTTTPAEDPFRCHPVRRPCSLAPPSVHVTLSVMLLYPLCSRTFAVLAGTLLISGPRTWHSGPTVCSWDCGTPALP